MRSGATGSESAFLGIPYAAPPLGDLRWRPPQPPAPWPGTRAATQYGPACPQLPAKWLPYPTWKEDCLYLNIWTPQILEESRLPVIVYFHGGSNQAGYSHLTPLGPALSPLGIVVVTANYRLGPLGFLALPALTAESPHHSSGNYGLLDQIAALRWVRDNISHFGGDSERVTVMGQSAGAVDICLLMTAPQAQGLFQRAILESGDCQATVTEDIRAPISDNGISDAGEGTGKRLIADLGIADTPAALRQLRTIPVSAILSASSHDGTIHYGAIVDGWVIPNQPTRIFEEGRQARVPVLAGSNADEATVFASGPATVSEYKQHLREDIGPYIAKELETWPVSSDADVPRQYLRLQADIFAYGAWSAGRATTRLGQSAWLYRFTWKQCGRARGLGAYHGEELAFLSNTFPANWGTCSGERAFGVLLRQYWANFAKTGDPNGVGLPGWPAYSLRADRIEELGQRIQSAPASPNLRRIEDLMNAILAGATR